MTTISDITHSWVAVNRVLICDEHPTARTALTTAVTHAIPTAVDVTSLPNGPDLVAQYARSPADLVLIGIRGGKPCGVDALDGLLVNYPDAPVLVYGSVDDTRTITAAIKRGARGFLLWDSTKTFASPARQQADVRLSPGNGAMTAPARLTDRELQILRGMAHGYSNGEIGRKLYLSEDTIKTHARRLFHKLGAHDRAHAVALGMRNDLVA